MYFPKAMKIIAKHDGIDVTYKQDSVGATYVRLDAVPNGRPLIFLVISIACLLNGLSGLLEGDWLLSGLLFLATAGFAWSEWLVQKQWQAIQDALP